MFNGHKTEISVWKCTDRWCKLCWSKWFTISQVRIHCILIKRRPIEWNDFRNESKHFCNFVICSAMIQKIYSHWSTGARKGRMSGQIPTTLDPSLTQRMLMNSYSSANHDDIHTIAARNGNYGRLLLIFGKLFGFEKKSWKVWVDLKWNFKWHEYIIFIFLAD